MLKFGSVTLDVSHPRTFAKVLAKGERARYVGVFNDCFRTDEEVKTFADTFGVKIYSDLDKMIEDIDIGLVHCCNWDKHLDYIMHFVRAGKPVFVDKPLVGNLYDCEKLVELEKAGARILGTSAMRFLPEVLEAKKKMAKMGVKPLHTVTTVGVDDYNYAIHAIELILGLNDSKPKSVRYIGTAAVEDSTEKCESYFITFENGATATYHNSSKKYVTSNTMIMTSSTEAESDIIFSPDINTLYDPLIDRICESMETGENKLATMEEMIDALKVLYAGRVSRNEGGSEISLDSEKLYEIKFDGYEFERAYAAAAHKK